NRCLIIQLKRYFLVITVVAIKKGTLILNISQSFKQSAVRVIVSVVFAIQGKDVQLLLRLVIQACIGKVEVNRIRKVFSLYIIHRTTVKSVVDIGFCEKTILIIVMIACAESH